MFLSLAIFVLQPLFNIIYNLCRRITNTVQNLGSDLFVLLLYSASSKRELLNWTRNISIGWDLSLSDTARNWGRNKQLGAEIKLANSFCHLASETANLCSLSQHVSYYQPIFWSCHVNLFSYKGLHLLSSLPKIYDLISKCLVRIYELFVWKPSLWLCVMEQILRIK